MFNPHKKNIFKDKRTMVTMAIIGLCIFLSVSFTAENEIYGLTKGFFFFLLIPYLYIRFILKEKISLYGLNVKEYKKGLIWAAFMLLLSFLLVYILAEYTKFLPNYKIDPNLKSSFWFFIVWMLFYVNLNLFFLEFFFRGFLMHTLTPFYSGWSVVIQALIFGGVVFLIGGINKETWQMAPYLIMAITGGITAYKTKSIIFSWLGGLFFMILANAYLISLMK